ncbi:hypothetical protein [Caldisalinibacter kiritimatiensis]|uniref:Lipoprotein n=1 Tax=Caldisalinibacter kiritimatiensis TaxID=1304284 RepID=R1CLV0_9FIRM|nr:hypothetical protein [Caldisalinibacter kiritimatiensis]EOC99685.1 hypothetical protein L21TH_2328 [Caldisalinibacter kiritimatiensis]
MNKKTLKIIIVCASITFILLTGCASKETKVGLKVYNWSSSIGAENGNSLDKTRYSYYIDITNENPKSLYIKSVEPIISENIKDKVLKAEIVEVNKHINSNETIEVEGKIIIDTKGLNKTDIIELEPFITDIKVITEETINLNYKLK